MHVVVLSGSNISIVAEATLRVLFFLPLGLRYGVGGLAMVLFAMMTGGGAAAVRAVIMALVGILARYLHRSADAMRTLLLAGAAMVLWNPLEMLYDTSFLLSMSATFGLIAFSPSVERALLRTPLRHPKLSGVRSVVASTIAVEVFMLPMLLYFTGTLSFLSIPANALALPVVPAAMLFGFLAGLFGFVHPLLALPFAMFADVLLRWLMLVAQTVAAIPVSVYIVPAFGVWILLAVYAPLTWFAVRAYMKNAAQ